MGCSRSRYFYAGDSGEPALGAALQAARERAPGIGRVEHR